MKRKPHKPEPPENSVPLESLPTDDPLRQMIEALNKPPVEAEMTDEERATLSRLLTELYERDQRRAELEAANNERLQRALDMARERFPRREAENFDAFMSEVLKIYKELD